MVWYDLCSFAGPFASILAYTLYITDGVYVQFGITSTAHRDRQSQIKVLATAILAHDHRAVHMLVPH